MRAIIENNEIIFKSGYTDNMGCPQVTMYQIEIFRCSRQGTSKRQANMAPKLTSMAMESSVDLLQKMEDDWARL